MTQRYESAKEIYARIGVNTDFAIEKLKNIEQAYNRLSGETRTTVRPTSQNNQTVSSFFLNKGRER